jgi:oxalate---CoA ligase
MLLSLSDLGGIEEIETGLRWDAALLRREIGGRVGELSRLGVGAGSRVAICHGGSAAFFADLLAAWSLGATAICLDPALTSSELTNVLAFANPAVALVSRNPVATGGVPAVDLSGARSSTEGSVGPLPAAGEPALVLFTSGTSGVPKGVVLDYRALAARIAANIAEIGEGALARSLITLPTHFGHGLIGNALTPLLAGCTIVLPALGMALAKDLGRIVDRHRICFLSSVPALWRMALKLGAPPKGDSLKRVHVGSAPLSAALWSDVAAWARCETVNCYGMTETANWFAGQSSRERIAEGLVGRPWGGAVAVRGEDETIAAGGGGEILVQSPALMTGYLDRPDLTADAIRDGWYHTGDRGHIDETGRIWLTGRIKDEINRAGFKVQPAEIDRLLEMHPAVFEACAFAVPDPVGGESVAVAIRLEPGTDASTESLRAWCRERLRHEAVPERWFLMDAIPRTARGKISRDAVRRMLVKDLG